MKTQNQKLRYRAYTTVGGEGEVVEVEAKKARDLLSPDQWHATPEAARAALRQILEEECLEAEQRLARRRAWIAAYLPEGQ